MSFLWTIKLENKLIILFFAVVLQIFTHEGNIVLTLCLIQIDILKPVEDNYEGTWLINIFQKHLYFPSPNTFPICVV